MSLRTDLLFEYVLNIYIFLGKKRLSPTVSGKDFQDDPNMSPFSSDWIQCQDDTISSSSSLSVSSNSAVTIKPSPIIKTSTEATELGPDPRLWTHQEVAHFLRKNDCSAYCESFLIKVIFNSLFFTVMFKGVLSLNLLSIRFLILE